MKTTIIVLALALAIPASVGFAGIDPEVDLLENEQTSQEKMEALWATTEWGQISSEEPFEDYTYNKWVRASGDKTQTRFCTTSRTSKGEEWYTANNGRRLLLDALNPQILVVKRDHEWIQGTAADLKKWEEICQSDGKTPATVWPPQTEFGT